MGNDGELRDGAISAETARRLNNAATVAMARVQLARRRLRQRDDPARIDGELAEAEGAIRTFVAMAASPRHATEEKTTDTRQYTSPSR